MTSKEMQVGGGHTPTIEENSAIVYSNTSNLYINDPSYIDKDFLELQQNQLIKDFANVKPDIYELIKATNPTLLLFVNLARDIMGAEG